MVGRLRGTRPRGLTGAAGAPRLVEEVPRHGRDRGSRDHLSSLPGGAHGDHQHELRPLPPRTPPAAWFDRVWGTAATGTVVVLVLASLKDTHAILAVGITVAVVAGYLTLRSLFQ